MGSLNKVMLIGNLTRVPEVRTRTARTTVVEFGMAANRKYKDSETGEWREEVTFVDVTVFGKLAETADKYLYKGSAIFLEGRLQLDQWKDKETGKGRSKLRVVGEAFQFLDRRPEGAGQKGDDVDLSV